jgi:hypothetical protein
LSPTSAYLTACLGILLAIAILFRQLDPLDAGRPTLLEEGFTLFATLVFTYVAAWCAGFLAVVSTKNSLQRSTASSYHHNAQPDEHRKRIEPAADTTALTCERGAIGPERPHAPAQSSDDRATMLLRASNSIPEIANESIDSEHQHVPLNADILPSAATPFIPLSPNIVRS